jgi:hypothetical protein
MGDCRLVYHAATGMLYASVWNEPNLGNTGLTHPNKDVYPIDPATMTVGSRLNIVSTFIVSDDFDAALNPAWGPRWIGSSGNYLFIQWNATSYYQIIRVNPTNLADRSTNVGDDCTRFHSEQLALTPTQIVSPDPYRPGLRYTIIGWNSASAWTACDMPLYYPIACEYCSLTTLIYAVDGNGNFFRINDLVAETFDQFDMAIWQAGAKACRLRYSGLTEDIYLPSMTTDSVILWDPVTEIAQVKTGFTNPIDVVFTPTRAFAVQNSPAESLREIT